MRYPKIPVRRAKIESLTRFGGLNRQSRPGSGEFTAMKNLTSQAYPLITPRAMRGVYAKPAAPQGLIGGNKLCYVDGSDFVIGEDRYPMGLSVLPEDNPKQLQSMGAWVIILPDKKYINTLSPEDRGNLEAVFAGTAAEITLCGEEGVPLEDVALGATAPEAGLWLDTSGEIPALWEYSESQGQWAERTCFVKIAAPGIEEGFFPEDTVRVSGFGPLDGLRRITACLEDALVLEGAAEPGSREGSLEIARRMPLVDFLTECDNRLWGCRYGTDREGNFVNEVYASKQGDFRNWECFQGLSTDSYAVSFGQPGPFTGATGQLGYPLFFREECLHKIFGAEPASYRVQTTHCPGVQAGSHRSIALAGHLLVYKGREGIYAFDGSMPVDISKNLGRRAGANAAAGALGERYYISMEEEGGWSLYVWDSSLGLWHREDSLQCSHICPQDGVLYAVDQGTRNILTLLGDENAREEVGWEAELAPFGLEDPEQKHIARLVLRLTLDAGSRLTCEARYDGQDRWETLCMVFGTELRSLRLPLRPRRCDHMTLRLRGTGPVKIYSIAKIYEKGSDCP